MQKLNAKKNGKKIAAKKKTRDPIPEHFESLEAAADFWDTHSLADYLDEFREVKNVRIELSSRRFRLEDELAKKIGEVARQRGVSSETLVNLWLQQKLSEALKREKRQQQAAPKRAGASQYA
jgi:hypothetical protein